ncbi:MAG: threonine/serine exporter family protein [Eubacteriales bacterium]|nr:threonine/serine exporter family protein [Eubacteriales bacterium]
MMKDYVIQILMACIGSCGFGMIFHMKRRRLPLAALGGGLIWALFLLCSQLGCSLFAANLIAAFFAAAYAECMAHLWKAPATIFVVTAFIPLVPGGSLYYTMSAIVAENRIEMLQYGSQTGLVAGALAFGILMFTAVYHLICKIVLRIKQKTIVSKSA